LQTVLNYLSYFFDSPPNLTGAAGIHYRLCLKHRHRVTLIMMHQAVPDKTEPQRDGGHHGDGVCKLSTS